MAAQAGARILPWVDNIAARMAHLFSCGSRVSPAPAPASLRQTGWAPAAGRPLLTPPVCPSVHGQDSALRASFLSAAILLTNALQWETGAQSYRFTQIPELIHCLLVSGPRARPAQRVSAGSPADWEAAGWARPGRTLMPAPTLPTQCVLQQEPNFLATRYRLEIILVIVGLR